MELDRLANELLKGNVSVEKQFLSMMTPVAADTCQPNTKFLIWSYIRKHPKLEYMPMILLTISRLQVALVAADPNPYNAVGSQQVYKMMCFAYASLCLFFNKPIFPERVNIDLQSLLYMLDEISSIKLYTKRKIVSQILSKAIDQQSVLLITKCLEAIEDDASVIPDMQYRKPLLDLIPLLLQDQSELHLECLSMIVKMRRSCISYQDRRDLIKEVFSKLNIQHKQSLSILLTLFDLHMGMEFEEMPEIHFVIQNLLNLEITDDNMQDLLLIYKHCSCDLRIPYLIANIDPILIKFVNAPIFDLPFDDASLLYDHLAKMIRDRYATLLPVILQLNQFPLLCLGASIFKQKINIYEQESNDTYDAQLFNRLVAMEANLQQLSTDPQLPILYYSYFIKNITENYIWDSFCFNQLFFKEIQCASRFDLFETLLKKCFSILQHYFNQEPIVTMMMDLFLFFSQSITCVRFASESQFLLSLHPNRTLLFEHCWPKYRINYYHFLAKVAFTTKTNQLYINIMQWIEETCKRLLEPNASGDVLSMTGLVTDVFFLNEAIGLLYAMMGLIMGATSEQGLQSVLDCLLMNIIPFINHIFPTYKDNEQFLYAICKLSNCLYENDGMSTFKQNKIIFVLYRDLGLLMMRVMEMTNSVRCLTYMLKFQSQFLTEHLFFSAMIFYKDPVLLESLHRIYTMLLTINREICQHPKFLICFTKWFKRGLGSDLFNIDFNDGFIRTSKMILSINMEYENEDLKSGAVEVIRDWTKRCTQNATMFQKEDSIVINSLRTDIETLQKWLWLMIVDYMNKDENGETISISCCIHNILLLIPITSIEPFMQYYNEPQLMQIMMEIGKDLEQTYSWVNIERVAQNLKQVKLNLQQLGILL